MVDTSANYPLLDSIDNPADLRQLPVAKLPALAAELRQFLIQSVSTRGGHFAAGLGTVELTVALHYVFDTPTTGWSGTSGTRPILIRSSRAGARGCPPSSSQAGSRPFQAAPKANTTLLAWVTRAPRSAPRWAWRQRLRI